jgi:hypothetical protein
VGFKNKENELLGRFQIGNLAPRRQARQLPMLVARNQGIAVELHPSGETGKLGTVILSEGL